ncbi:hypothetical protein ASPZODRAFT_528931 [Penicilliopsis zonata CBS 506.65]|uniref:Uncharacterized protein n=1 Tax=Penicilliopsis zonata CBS 506.65 TaxID=1073090 RepID=A0A1L9SF61_9EURO|nr:hypothetical protein ASPZODRAFT_528931 [Penicilliopsis zonata CBS 506.65]OJJ45809.1 hypothetical protein ASPZODRAFT_528931 [Penicilliopsis zonata CBS 506.65]
MGLLFPRRVDQGTRTQESTERERSKGRSSASNNHKKTRYDKEIKKESDSTSSQLKPMSPGRVAKKIGREVRLSRKRSRQGKSDGSQAGHQKCRRSPGRWHHEETRFSAGNLEVDEYDDRVFWYVAVV